ncbi:MAG: multidrug effflux MFS transporter [Microbacterium sp.]
MFIIVLGALVALGPFTMDLYLPAFPLVAEALDTSAAMVQVTLTATAVGLGVGQLIVGPLSDARGRRIPLIAATALHVASSMVVAVAPTVEVVTMARFGQGCGAAAGAVVAAAMVRDLFGGHRLVRISARIALITGLAPIVAPVIGSQLLLLTDWRGVFWILAAFGALILVAVAVLLPETLPRDRRADAGGTTRSRLQVLLADRVYIGTVVISAMVFAAIVSYLAASPFIFQDGFGLSEQQFGLLFAVNAVGLLLATQISALLMRRFRPAMLLRAALPALLISGLAFIALGGGGNLIGAILASSLLVALHGFCGPCIHVLVVAKHQARAGTAVALCGFANSAIGGGLALVPALIGGVSLISLGVVVAAAAVIAILALATIVRPQSVPALGPE